MQPDVLIGIVTLIVAPLTATLTWFFSRRKEAANTTAAIATGANTAVETILSVMKELRAEVDQLEEENRALRAKVKELELMVKKLKEEIHDVDG